MTRFYRLKPVLFILVLLLILPSMLTAGELPSLSDVLPVISDTDRDLLLSDGELLRFHPEGVSPGLLPETALTGSVARQLINADLNIGIEGLFFTTVDDLPAAFMETDADSRELILYNILRSVSTLEGLEYYSASRDEMRLLFEESWTIADEKSKEALPDPLVSSIPADDTIFIHQKDKSFGKNTQQMNFKVSPEAFAVNIINLSPMRYKGIIKVVNPGNMQIHLIVVPVEEGILIYGTMSARTRDVKAFIDRAQDSFTNRVIALAGWYRDRLLEEF